MPDDRLDQAMELFVESDLLALPVVEKVGGRVMGLVRRSDVTHAYLTARPGRAGVAVRFGGSSWSRTAAR